MSRRRVSDRVLRRWLLRGRPGRVGRMLAEDQEVSDRLEAMTRLSPEASDAIEVLVKPAEGFDDRVSSGVRRRLETAGTASLLVEMLGAGLDVVRLVLRPGGEDERSDEGEPQ